MLASGSYDRTVRLWDVLTGEEKAKLSGPFNIPPPKPQIKNPKPETTEQKASAKDPKPRQNVRILNSWL